MCSIHLLSGVPPSSLTRRVVFALFFDKIWCFDIGIRDFIRVSFFRQVPIHHKKLAYEGIVLSILLYGCETWTLTKKLEDRLRIFHNRCVRMMCRVNLWNTRKFRITQKDLESRVGIRPLQYYVDKRQLQWAGHVMRMSKLRLPRKFISSWVANPRPKGRPQITYGQRLENVIKRKNLDLKTWDQKALDREWWRSFIKQAWANLCFFLFVNYISVPQSRESIQASKQASHFLNNCIKIYPPTKSVFLWVLVTRSRPLRSLYGFFIMYACRPPLHMQQAPVHIRSWESKRAYRCTCDAVCAVMLNMMIPPFGWHHFNIYRFRVCMICCRETDN